MFFSRIKKLEKRVTDLENAQHTHTWVFGEVDLPRLARIVEEMERRQRTADAITCSHAVISNQYGNKRNHGRHNCIGIFEHFVKH